MTDRDTGEGSSHPSLKDIATDYLPAGFASMSSGERAVLVKHYNQTGVRNMPSMPRNSVPISFVSNADRFVRGLAFSFDSVEVVSAMIYGGAYYGVEEQGTYSLARAAIAERRKLEEALDVIQIHSNYQDEAIDEDQIEVMQTKLSRYRQLQTRLSKLNIQSLPSEGR